MEYNSNREHLVIREYGRNIQKMIDFAVQIEDRDERTRFSSLIVGVMEQMVQAEKDPVTHEQKLWNHLYYMSGYKLDVDAPCSLEKRQGIQGETEKPSYGKNQIRFRVYGSVMEKMIQSAIEVEDEKEKDALILKLANQLKRMYISWNQSAVSDELIKDHLELLSMGKFRMSEDVKLISTTEIYEESKKKKIQKTNHKNLKGQKSQKSNNRRQGGKSQYKKGKR